MLVTVFRRLTGNKWKALSLFIGLVLAVAIAFCVPVYSNGILQRLLIKNLERGYIETGEYPTYISATFRMTGGTSAAIKIHNTMNDVIDKTIHDRMGLKEIEKGSYIKYKYFEYKTGKKDVFSQTLYSSFTFNCIDRFEDYVNVTAGRMYNPDRDDGIVEVVVSKKFLIKNEMTLNEVYKADSKFSNEGPIEYILVGVVEPKDVNDLFWFNEFKNFDGLTFAHNNNFKDRLLNQPDFSRHVAEMSVYSAIDYNDIKINNLANIVKSFDTGKDEFKNTIGIDLFEFGAQDTLREYIKTSDMVFASILIVVIPILVLLVFYIMMISKLKLDSEQNEISVMQSRGASRFQILRIYFVESLLLSGVALLLGPPLGLLLCRIIGSSNGFLEFVQRTPLEIIITPIALLTTGATALLFMLITMLPAFFSAGVNIVESKRKKAYKRLPFYHRYFLDVLLLGIGLYGYITINQKLKNYYELRQHYLMSVNNNDFLLYISGVVFALGAGMLFLRVYPMIVKLIFKLGKRIWPSWLYFSLNRAGQNRDASSLMLFLIMTLSIGIFSADAARSINNHIETNVKLKVGTDIIYTPKWKSYHAVTGEEVRGPVEPGGDTIKLYDEGVLIQEIPIVFHEMFTDIFSDTDEVESAARVYYESGANVRCSSRIEKDVEMMLIDPYDFAVTANSADYMNPYQLNEYINALLMVENGALISNNVMKALDIQQGDNISIMSVAGLINCKVIAGIDSWPGIESLYIGKDGTLKNTSFVIAKLDNLFAENEILPYGFWIKRANGATDQVLYDALSESEHGVTQFDSSAAELVESKNDPVLQGTNGLLSVSFLTSMVICAIGFLIHWIISIKSRTLQFGISRALGVTKTGIMLMLISEQILISGTAVATGFVFGKFGSLLFVPLLGLNYMSPVDLIPFTVTAQRTDVYRILGLMGGMLLICFTILSGIIIRQKIDRAVKLGEE